LHTVNPKLFILYCEEPKSISWVAVKTTSSDAIETDFPAEKLAAALTP
jgi:hypothetical protein